MGQQYHLLDKTGKAYVIEATHALAQVRKPGDFGEKEYMVATNHWITKEMAPAKYPKAFLTSPERYATIEELVKKNYGSMNPDLVKMILGTADWFDGSAWHKNEWSGASMGPDRVLYEKSTQWSGVAVPEDGAFYACAGDAGGVYPPAPGQSGAFVKLVLKDSPKAVNATVKEAASKALYHAKGAVEAAKLSITDRRTLESMLDEAHAIWWEGYIHERDAETLVVAKKAGEALPLYGEASTAYSETQAICHQVMKLIGK